MAIPTKQIGWSVEANLLYEILKELDKLNKVTAACCTTTTTTIAP